MLLSAMTPCSSARVASACALLREDAPASLSATGDTSLLGSLGLLALLCSHRCAADLILPTYDLARTLRDNATPVISGFHAPMEREALRYLMRGTQPVVHVPARGLEGMHLTGQQRAAVVAGRLLLLSPFDGKHSRLSAALAVPRNRLVGALADQILIIHALPGGTLEAACAEFLAWGKPLYALPSDANAHLFAMGAQEWQGIP